MIVQELNNLLKVAGKRPGHTKLSEIPKTDVFGINRDILEENETIQVGTKAHPNEKGFLELMEEYMKSHKTLRFT